VTNKENQETMELPKTDLKLFKGKVKDVL